LPAENPYSNAIFSVIQEYQSHRKKAKKSEVPKMRAKTTPKIDPVDEMLVALGLDPSELRKI
tara:strand:+ start:93 stop:278 length:186 start_codon:yes stop_codon:yes gene_type:complete